MLRSMRDGAKEGFLKYILLGFLVLAGGGLVLTDVGGFFRGGVGSTDVAKIGPIKISAQDFDRNVRRYLSQQNLAPVNAYRYGIIDNLLTNEINARLLTVSANELGFRVSDEQLTKELLEMTESMALTDDSRKLALQRILRQQGVGEAEFLSSLRQETANSLLKNSIMGGLNVTPPALANVLYQFDNESRDVDTFVLKNASITDIDQPGEESLKLFYEANKAEYLIPESRTITLATLNNEMIKDRIEISEDELKSDYENNLETFTVPERRMLEQAILDSPENADKVFDAVKGGALLKNAVQEITGSAKTYQNPDEYEQTGLLDDIAGPVFAADINELIGPIETPLGWHILRVTKVIEPDVVPFEDVKSDLKNDLMQDLLMDEMLEAANTIDDRLAAGEELDSVVDDLGLTTQQIGPFKRTGVSSEQDKDLFADFTSDREDILETAFDFDIGESAPIMELKDGSFIVIRIDDVQEQGYEDYESVKSEVKSKWISEQKALTNQAKAQELLTDIRNDMPFQDAAKKAGVSVKTYNGIKRKDPGDLKLPYQALEQVFTMPEGEVMLAPYNDGYILARIKSIKLPDTDKLSTSDLDPVKESLMRVMPAEGLNQYLNYLNRKEKVTINRRLLDQMYGVQDTGS